MRKNPRVSRILGPKSAMNLCHVLAVIYPRKSRNLTVHQSRATAGRNINTPVAAPGRLKPQASIITRSSSDPAISGAAALTMLYSPDT